MLVSALALTGCTSPEDGASPTPSPTAQAAVTSCDELPGRIADAVQAYVDSFADVEAEEVTAQASSGLEGFRSATAELRARGEELGCDPDEIAAALPDELAALSGGTPVQDAVLATLVADPLGTVDPSDPRPVDIEVSTTADLTAALSLAGSGSTIRIASGEYVIGEPLVALRPVTLVGAGIEQTVLRSIAPGAGLLIDADGDVTVRDLELRHEGAAAASVAIVTSGGYSFENLRLTGGTAADSGAGGFGLILRTASNPVRADGSLQQVTGVELSGHDGGGIFVGGDAAPQMADITVTRSDGCGLCFVEDSGGTVETVLVRGVPIGVRVDDAAAPQLSELRIRNASIGVALTGTGSPSIRQSRVIGARTGFEVVGSGSPSLVNLTVTDSVDIALRLADATRASVSDVIIDGATTVGIGVADQASPALSASAITTTGDVGVIWAGDSAGTADELTVTGSRLGLQVSDSAAPVVSDVTVRSVGEASMLASGASSGRVTRLACPADAPVALIDDATTQVRQSPTCVIADAR